MTKARIATGAEQPINRDGAVSQFAGQEGDLVGRNADGDWVQADAVAGVSASGVLMAPVTDPADFNNEEITLMVQANRELVGENRIAAVKHGIIVENVDGDWGFTPGEPVYLGENGGFTQTPPTGAGEITQVVGEASGEGEAVFLDVAPDYVTA